MPRKPSAAVPRSETTAELIARISAERDAPPAPDHRPTGRSRAGVLDAPAPARRTTARAGLSRQRTAQDAEAHHPRAFDEGRARLAEPPALARSRRDDDLRNSPRSRTSLHSVGTHRPSEPEPDDTPTEVFGFVEPIAPPRRRGRRIAPFAVAATALVGISIAVAQGYTFPGLTDPGTGTSGAVLVDATVPEPGPTGPTVPAPLDAAPQDAAPAVAPEGAADEPAADPQSDVTLTDSAVPPSDYSY